MQYTQYRFPFETNTHDVNAVLLRWDFMLFVPTRRRQWDRTVGVSALRLWGRLRGGRWHQRGVGQWDAGESVEWPQRTGSHGGCGGRVVKREREEAGREYTGVCVCVVQIENIPTHTHSVHYCHNVQSIQRNTHFFSVEYSSECCGAVTCPLCSSLCVLFTVNLLSFCRLVTFSLPRCVWTQQASHRTTSCSTWRRTSLTESSRSTWRYAARTSCSTKSD